MAKRKKSRIYARQRGGETRYYADFRDFAGEGGGREALVPSGEKRATTDPKLAEYLAGERVKDLKRRRLLKNAGGIIDRDVLATVAERIEDDATLEALIDDPAMLEAFVSKVHKAAPLKAFAAAHLTQKAKSGKVSAFWLGQAERFLGHASDFFGATRDLSSITVRDVQKYANHLSQLPSGRNGRAGEKATLSEGTVRHYLNALSNLYRRAQSEGVVQPGYNPVASLMEKPTAAKKEARWLEIHEAALFLEAARRFKPKRDDIAMSFLHPLVATFLLTGGRKSEVLGLEVEDVSFDRKSITFRPNEWRRLKTETSHRTVPMWPQLEEILREYVFGGNAPPGRLLFPSARPNPKATAEEKKKRKESMVRDVRKALDSIGETAGWKPGEIRTKMFRHTYTAARLQTTDRGAPVSVFTVAKDLGHGGDSLVKRVYGHLGTIRHRSDVVEYRVENHRAELKDRLRELVRT